MPISIVCRPNGNEAEEYAQHCVDNADWEAIDHHHSLYTGTYGSRTRSIEESQFNLANDKKRVVLGYGGGFVIRGDPDHVADQLIKLHEAGFDGVAIGLVNYLDELPYFAQEVIPRLECKGLRASY